MGIILMVLIFGASAFVQWRLRSKFAQYSEVGLQNGMTCLPTTELTMCALFPRPAS